MQERSAAVWQRIFQNYRSYSLSSLLKLLYDKLLFAWNNGMFESNVLSFVAHGCELDCLLDAAAILPCAASAGVSTVYMLFLYAANVLSAGISLFNKKTNSTFFPNLFIFGTMLYLQLFENAPRRAMIAIPFMICNSVFLLSQWYENKIGATALAYLKRIPTKKLKKQQ